MSIWSVPINFINYSNFLNARESVIVTLVIKRSINRNHGRCNALLLEDVEAR